ncbi:MAG: hypothetical protein HKN73_16655 [Gemmatimonadetes bacterium]|nr:hypothetical protein [Gemmatimonadota bacterium]
MKPWWKRVRGVLGMGGLWGAAAGVVGTVGGMIAGLIGGAPVLLAGVSGVAMATIGFILGVGFGTALTFMHGNRTLEEWSAKRAAGVGFLAGSGLTVGLNLASLAWIGASAPISILVPALVAGAIAYGSVTALLASATVALAKRAPDAGYLESGVG